MTDDTDPHVDHVERGVPRAQQRRTRVVGALVASLAAILIGALVVAGLALGELSGLRGDALKSACSDRLVADFAAATGRALAAPPARNAARTASVKDILRSADRLARSDRVCAHGVPAPLVPTPVSTTRGSR